MNGTRTRYPAPLRNAARFLGTILPMVAATVALAPFGSLAPAAAYGQILTMGGPGGPGGLGGPGGRMISRPAMERYAKVLGLDDAQTQAAQALHEAYAEGTRAANKDMAAKMKELNAELKDGDMEVLHDKIPAVMGEHGERVRELEQTFLSDIKALLTPAQAENAWPALDRLRRREQWLKAGVLSGSNVDLTELVETMKLPETERAKLNQTLGQYEQDMDRVLQDIAREQENQGAKQPVRGARAAGEGGARMVMTIDGEGMRDRMKKQREESAKVKDLNQRYARLLAAELPEELRGKLEEQYKFAAYRNVYKESSTARKLAAAEKFDDLTQAQRDRIREISESYRRQARAANDRWAAAQEQAEAAGKFAGGGGGGMVINFGGDGGQPEDLKEARQARRDLDKKADADLEGLLSDDQKARLPKSRIAGGGPGGQDVDVIADGEGNHAVFVSAFETAEDDGEGVIVSRSVVVTAGGDETEPTETAEKDAKKKDEKKK